MANTGKHIAPHRNPSPGRSVPIVVATAGMGADMRLSPRVEALRKLVAAGQYQVSARYLAHQIFRAAGVAIE